MKVAGVIFEDFVNYKKPCMTIMMPYCSFKCDKECGKPVCQNSALADTQIMDVNIEYLLYRYLNNPITQAVCFQGLEPLDSWNELYEFCLKFRFKCMDDIVIYTGYYKEEIADKIPAFKSLSNVVIKYGRFIPDQDKHFDEVLGVWLASDNQYGEVI